MISLADFLHLATPVPGTAMMDAWPAFEAAFQVLRAGGSGPKNVRHGGRLYVPKPLSDFYYCSRRLDPRTSIHLEGDGPTTVVRFPPGCPHLRLESYVRDGGAHRTDDSTIREIRFEGTPYSTTFAPVWAPNRAFVVGQYVAPTAWNGYVARVVQAGATGADEPAWPRDPWAWTDGAAVADGGVRYEMQVAAGVWIKSVGVKLVGVQQAGVYGPGALLTGHPGWQGDLGGAADHWSAEDCRFDGNLREGWRAGWAKNVGTKDVSIGVARGLHCKGNKEGGVYDVADIGNRYEGCNAEGNYAAGRKVRPFYVDPTSGTAVLEGCYSEGSDYNWLGRNAVHHAGNLSPGLDPACGGYSRGDAHVGDWLAAVAPVRAPVPATPTTPAVPGLAAGATLGHHGADHRAERDVVEVLALFLATERGEPRPRDKYAWAYHRAAGLWTFGVPYLNLALWTLTSDEHPSGPGYWTIRTGYFTGVSPAGATWYHHPTRPGGRYVALDLAAWVVQPPDDGARRLGDVLDTPAATVGHARLQVTRAGWATTPWRPGYLYATSAVVPKVRVRARAAGAAHAWELAVASGRTGATEPAWPAAPAAGQEVQDGTAVWRYAGLAAEVRPYGAVGGGSVVDVGAGDVALGEDDARFLAHVLTVVGAPPVDRTLTLPTGVPGAPAGVEPYERWIRNRTPASVFVRVAGGTPVEVPRGTTRLVFFDGATLEELWS